MSARACVCEILKHRLTYFYSYVYLQSACCVIFFVKFVNFFSSICTRIKKHAVCGLLQTILMNCKKYYILFYYAKNILCENCVSIHNSCDSIFYAQNKINRNHLNCGAVDKVDDVIETRRLYWIL